MTIQNFDTLVDADAIANPKVVRWNLTHYEVLTGSDIPAPPAQPTTRFVSAQDYRNRFTTPELLSLLSSADVGVRLMVLKVSTAPQEGIDLLSPAVAQGLAYLVAQGILAADRPAQIVA